jgi:nicotinate-nucleotide pyrophosphorylase (carboxylating)
MQDLVAASLAEDIGPGDLTADATIPLSQSGSATIIAKEYLVVAGQAPAAETFRQVAMHYGVDVSYSPVAVDGDLVADRAPVARIEGNYRAMLVAERLALNFLMRLSGIATHARPWVVAGGPDLKVIDTRKSTPGHRQLEKAAVRAGGAFNHRMGLYDGILIKDNHIAAVGSLATAVARAREHAHHLVRVEVEITDLKQLDEAIAVGVDAFLLDNMDDELLTEAVARIRSVRPTAFVEASGNMTPERIAGINHLELDAVSCGGLIHQSTWVDLSMTVHG